MQVHGGMTSLGTATRETPVRTEPHPTKRLRLSFPQSYSFSCSCSCSISLCKCLGGDVAGQGNAGNPGSDGASPYHRASPLFSPIVLVLVLDFFMRVHGGVTSLSRATRETPVRTEPHPTKGFPPIVLVLDLLMGAGQNRRSVTLLPQHEHDQIA
jgi:hypothetical protein